MYIIPLNWLVLHLGDYGAVEAELAILALLVLGIVAGIFAAGYWFHRKRDLRRAQEFGFEKAVELFGCGSVDAAIRKERG
jgi:uncharacterized iron-regulated membrane protein